MTHPKFIITMDGYFRLGLVNLHKDLLKPGDSCLGGGYYHFDITIRLAVRPSRLSSPQTHDRPYNGWCRNVFLDIFL